MLLMVKPIYLLPNSNKLPESTKKAKLNSNKKVITGKILARAKFYFLLKDIDECKNNPCNVTQICLNSKGSYKCGCPKGFRMDNITNECRGNLCVKSYLNIICVDIKQLLTVFRYWRMQACRIKSQLSRWSALRQLTRFLFLPKLFKWNQNR